MDESSPNSVPPTESPPNGAPGEAPGAAEETGSRRPFSRRGFLAGGALAGGLAIAATSCAPAASSAAPAAAASPSPAASGTPAVLAGPNTTGTLNPPALGGFVFFTNFQAAIVQAAAARLIPTDENGPGAAEAGVVYFIDRQLESEYGFVGERYTLGPFQNGTPTQGDQSGMSMRERYRVGIQGLENYAQQLYQKGFAALSPDQQDRILTDLQAGKVPGFDGASFQAVPTTQGSAGTETSIQRPGPGGQAFGAAAFFQLLLSHTVAGFFCDPVHGGNQNLVGWKLIGFPGAQMSYASWISRYGVAFDQPFRSLADYQGQFGNGM